MILDYIFIVGIYIYTSRVIWETMATSNVPCLARIGVMVLPIVLILFLVHCFKKRGLKRLEEKREALLLTEYEYEDKCLDFRVLCDDIAVYSLIPSIIYLLFASIFVMELFT